MRHVLSSACFTLAACRLFALLAMLAAAVPSAAQCSSAWSASGPLPGLTAIPRCMATWDPDGAGPATPLLAIGGGFYSVPGIAFPTCVIAWDPATSTFVPIGPAGWAGEAIALLPLPNGDLVAAGSFPTAGGVQVNGIARWNGSTWSPLGAGFSFAVGSGVMALAAMPNGDVVAGGNFLFSGGTAVNHIARWDGSTWSPLGTGIAYPFIEAAVLALTTLPNGDLVAGGSFPIAGGAVIPNIARWDGSTWSPLGTGITSGLVKKLATLPNGDVVATVDEYAPSNATGVTWRWNGSAWSPFGPSPSFRTHALALLSNGDLLAGSASIQRWDGSTWSLFAAGPGSGASNIMRALAVLPNGDVIAGGDFDLAGGVPASRVARWDGTSWSALVAGFPGLSDSVVALAAMPDGDVVAGGYFLSASGAPANRLARWDGSTWTALGSGVDDLVTALAPLPNGDLVAGGFFTTAGGVAVNRVARWNGSAWSAMGVGLTHVPNVLMALPNGDVVAGGAFPGRIARWNGSSWTTLGSGLGGGGPLAAACLPNGDIVVGGSFDFAGTVAVNNIARWNGTTWSPLGTGAFGGPVQSLLTLPNGHVVAAGNFSTMGGVAVNRIARWDGATWSPLGSGLDNSSFALQLLPNGDVLAAGNFMNAGGVAANRIARWNGTAWAAVGTGVDQAVFGLAQRPNGDVAVGGGFMTAGGAPSPFFAVIAPTCPALGASYGNGCASSGGSNTLAAASLPWVGSTLRTTGTGLPSVAIVLAVFGTSSFPPGAMPLSSLLPFGGAGCDLLASPDLLITPIVTTTGTVQSQVTLPNSPSLAGINLYHQMVPLEIDPVGNWIATTATNALQLVVGAL